MAMQACMHEGKHACITVEASMHVWRQASMHACRQAGRRSCRHAPPCMHAYIAGKLKIPLLLQKWMRFNVLCFARNIRNVTKSWYQSVVSWDWTDLAAAAMSFQILLAAATCKSRSYRHMDECWANFIKRHVFHFCWINLLYRHHIGYVFIPCHTTRKALFLFLCRPCIETEIRHSQWYCLMFTPS